MSQQIIDGHYNFQWLPTQSKVLDAVASMQYDNIMYCGGFGSGKSRLLGELALEISMNYPGCEFLFWRKTRAAIEDTTYRIFLEQVMPPEYITYHNKSKLIVKDVFGGRYDFLGLDRVTRKGPYFGDVALIDECIELEEAEDKMIEGRLRSHHFPRPQKISVTNPGAPGSFWHKDYVVADTRKKNNAYFSASSFENIHNPPAYFERLRQWLGTQYGDRYVLSMWKAFRGAIYENFDPKKAICKPFKIPDSWEKWLAVDFGFDHPMVLLWLTQCPATGRIYCYRQIYQTHVMVRHIVADAKKIDRLSGENISTIYADHDEENRAQFEADWIETQLAVKEVKPGIQTVQMAMLPLSDRLPGFQIFDNSWSEVDGLWYGLVSRDEVLKEEGKPTCLQEEIPGYKWGKDDKPVKIGDDACDALRYGLHSKTINEGRLLDGQVPNGASSYSRR